MTSHTVWAIAAVLAIAAVAHATMQYEIEAVKQEAFMMKACADAGGNWQRSWSNRPSCTRPEQKQ